jgi:hypothetical protein
MNRVVYLLAGAAVLALLAVATPAAAEISGPCTGQINGVDVGSHASSDTGQAIQIEKGATLVYSFTSTNGAAATEWEFSLAYGPYSGVVDTGSNPDGATSAAAGSAPLEDYAWLGVGLYLVSGDILLEDGSTCTGAALIQVKGNPLTTLVGGASAAIVVGGAAGLGIIGVLGWKSAMAALLAAP